MAVELDILLRISAMESIAGDLQTGTAQHLIDIAAKYTTGTTDLKFDQVWSDSGTANTTATIDVLGSKTAAVGGASLSLVEFNGLFIRHNGSANTLTVGAGSNPMFAGIFGSTGDEVVINPGGWFWWHAPNQGAVPVAGTGDIITLTSSSGSIAYDFLMYGRSA